MEGINTPKKVSLKAKKKKTKLNSEKFRTLKRGKQTGKFKYQLALDLRLIGRIIEESEDVDQKVSALRKWAKYANRRLRQIEAAPEVILVEWDTGWDKEKDETVPVSNVLYGAFVLDYSVNVFNDPFPRPICGRQNSRDGMFCLNPRGQGTDHVGYGPCLDCEKKLLQSLLRSGAIYSPHRSTFMISLNQINGRPTMLQACLDRAEQLEQARLEKVEPDIRTLYGVIDFVMRGGTKNLTEEERESGDWSLNHDDVKQLISLYRQVVEAKKAAFVMQKEVKLDATTIKALVGQIMSVVFDNVDASTARKIGGKILDNVVMPFRAQGKIGGDQEEYHEMGRAFAKSIANDNGIPVEEVRFPRGPREVEQG